MINNELLTHELQLGESLNKCVHSKRRADFSLMLAMLVDDAQEFSQFKLPENVVSPENTSEEQIRRHFDLPKKQPLALERAEQTSMFNQSHQIEDTRSLTNIRLNDALSAKPLAFRDDKQFVPTEVKSNVTLFCQSQFNETESQSSAALPVNEWLKAVSREKVQAMYEKV